MAAQGQNPVPSVFSMTDPHKRDKKQREEFVAQLLCYAHEERGQHAEQLSGAGTHIASTGCNTDESDAILLVDGQRIAVELTEVYKSHRLDRYRNLINSIEHEISEKIWKEAKCHRSDFIEWAVQNQLNDQGGVSRSSPKSNLDIKRTKADWIDCMVKMCKWANDYVIDEATRLHFSIDPRRECVRMVPRGKDFVFEADAQAKWARLCNGASEGLFGLRLKMIVRRASPEVCNFRQKKCSLKEQIAPFSRVFKFQRGLHGSCGPYGSIEEALMRKIGRVERLSRERANRNGCRQSWLVLYFNIGEERSWYDYSTEAALVETLNQQDAICQLLDKPRDVSYDRILIMWRSDGEQSSHGVGLAVRKSGAWHLC